MSRQLLSFSPAFLRAHGGGDEGPTSTEPIDFYAVGQLVLTKTAADAVRTYAVGQLVVLKST